MGGRGRSVLWSHAVGVAAAALGALLARPLIADADATPSKPTLFIVGDSTVRNSTKGQQGWGERIAEHFDLTRINVVNKAIGGRSSRTFITEGRWDEVLRAARPGDFVLIQFGHNDGIAPDDPQRPRGTIRGTGDETQQIVHPHTKQPEVVHTYGWYLRKYVADARARGMTPILCSPIPRLPQRKLSEPLPAASSYPLWAEQVARAEKAPFIDLHGMILRRYVNHDPAELKSKYFCDADNTHTSPAGAAFNAGIVAEGIRKLDGVELAEYLTPARAQ
jgi:rhamnogalacturonan acetylesterase